MNYKSTAYVQLTHHSLAECRSKSMFIEKSLVEFSVHLFGKTMKERRPLTASLTWWNGAHQFMTSGIESQSSVCPRHAFELAMCTHCILEYFNLLMPLPPPIPAYLNARTILPKITKKPPQTVFVQPFPGKASAQTHTHTASEYLPDSDECCNIKLVGLNQLKDAIEGETESLSFES